MGENHDIAQRQQRQFDGCGGQGGVTGHLIAFLDLMQVYLGGGLWIPAEL